MAQARASTPRRLPSISGHIPLRILIPLRGHSPSTTPIRASILRAPRDEAPTLRPHLRPRPSARPICLTIRRRRTIPTPTRVIRYPLPCPRGALPRRPRGPSPVVRLPQ